MEEIQLGALTRPDIALLSKNTSLPAQAQESLWRFYRVELTQIMRFIIYVQLQPKTL